MSAFPKSLADFLHLAARVIFGDADIDIGLAPAVSSDEPPEDRDGGAGRDPGGAAN